MNCDWSERRASYRARVAPRVEDRIARSSRQEKHPVYDFLFEYYSFPPSHLLRWSPGVGVVLNGVEPSTTDWPRWFRPHPQGSVIPPSAFPQHRISYLHWAIDYLDVVGRREPIFGCFGLHEWAMVYRTEEVRHSRVPLRLTPRETDGVVESLPVRCTHYDAFRFFTPAAVPRNRTILDRETTIHHDQPGCVHVTMDLYKFAYKVVPFIESEAVADAFELAIAARELDMRASPYDLRSYGFSSIAIETREGREVYVEAQRELHRRGVPVRERILSAYRAIESAISDSTTKI